MCKKCHCQPANRHLMIQIALVNNAPSSTNKKKAKRPLLRKINFISLSKDWLIYFGSY
uniref:Uncharacterized protein n=1 Tax=Triticum urartu TaxID=4572 RepID=A0A8R7V5B9_TRIUA